MTSSFCKLSIAALALLPLLAGCGSNSGSSGSTNVRLVNATADYDKLDLYWSNGNISPGVASYAAGGYAGIDSGSQTLSIRPAGGGTPGLSTNPSLAADTYYSIVAYVSNGVLAVTLLPESEAAPTAGTAKFRVFNTVSAEAGLLDAYVTTGTCSALGSISRISSNVRAVGSYVEVAASDAGTPYRVCITGADDRSDLRLDLPSFTLKNQQITTLVLASTPGGVLVHGVQLDQQGSAAPRLNASARVRLVADAPAGGTVTASVTPAGVTATTLGTNVPSPNIGGYTLVPAGTLTPTVRINGVAVAAPAFSVAPGADLTLLVAGTSTVAPIPDNNKPSTASGKPVKLRLVNGLNGFTNPVTLLDNSSPAASDVAFGTASTPTPVEATTTTAVLEAQLPGATSRMLNVTLLAGKVYTAFVLGDAANPTFTLRQDH